MGAGKTSVGRVLARCLGRRFSDSDQWIFDATGKTVRQLRDEIGVEAMHRLEADHLLAALREEAPAVIAAAASVVDDARCRAALEGSGVIKVWLRASPQTLAARFDSSAHRPAFGADARQFLAEQAAAREPEFRRLSEVVVDVDNATPEEAAAAVIEKVPPALS